MNGQKPSYKEKQMMMDEYIAKFDPYGKIEPLRFDLRSYSKYVDENNIKAKDITEDILKMFSF